MERSDTVLECKQIAKLHSSLENDPVIAKYIKLAGFNRNEDYVPRYSDKFLRSSLLAIHESSADNKTTLDLYRRLIAFYYSATFYTVNTLAEAMQIFTKKEIIHIFNDLDNLLTGWDKFIRSALLPLLFRDTFLEIMKEWKKRYEFVYVRQLDDVEEQARKVLTYLYWDHKYIQPWLETFSNIDLPEVQYQFTTEQQLDIKVIIHDIHATLNPLIHKYVLSGLPFDVVDKPAALPLNTTNPQEVYTCDEIEIKKEYIEPKATRSIENEPIIESEYDNSTPLSDANNEFHKDSAQSELFMIKCFDMGEEVNTCCDSKSEIGIKKSTALGYLDELRQYASQNGLVQIIEKLNEIGSVIREKTRDKLEEREAGRSKRLQNSQSIAGPSTSSNTNRTQLNNEEIITAIYQSASGLEKIQPSSIQRNEQVKGMNALQKKSKRQQRYREKKRDKLKQREAERRKRIQNSQSIARPSTSSNTNRTELNNEEIMTAISQSASGFEKTQPSSIQRNEQGKGMNALKKKRERQQRYREQNRDKLKQREAERRRRLQNAEMITEL